MSDVFDLLRAERRARFFFAALTQSALGTGAGYIALLLLAYDRYRSAWAISLVLAADLLPTMLLGPLFGAAADRFSRKGCAVTADVLRAGAFGGIALIDDFAATVVFAAIAGIGTGLFRPAALAAVPSLVEARRIPAATAIFGAVEDVGFTLGPAAAAAVLLVLSPADVMTLNAVTFGVSAAVLAGVRFGRANAEVQDRDLMPSLVREARDGMSAAAATPGLRAVLLLSSATLLFCGLFNVAELLFAKEELGAGASEFSLLVMLFGFGFLGGSLAGAKGGALQDLKRAYLAGLTVLAAGFIGSALAPTILVAALTFTAAGFGNGLVLVHERLIVQAVIPDRLIARIYGVKDALTAWAFGLAFALGGALIELFGVRAVLLGAGIGSALVAVGAAAALASTWRMPEFAEVRAEPADAAGGSPSAGYFCGIRKRAAGQDRPDLLAPGDSWLSLLDDLDKSIDH